VTDQPSNTRPPARYEDLRAVPEHLIGEILDGELVLTPRPAAQCVFTRGALWAALDRRRGGAEGGGSAGWWILDGAELRLGKSVVVPDLTGWRRQRMPREPQPLPARSFEVPPDWACEVLTPSTAIIDRTRKLGIYAAHGVCWTWLVDAAHRTIEVLWLEGDEWVVAGNYGGEQKARIPPFDTIEIPLAALWSPTDAPTPIPPGAVPTP
jgi:Uma2 family endonuclease